MPRELHAIIAHIRAVSANPSISTTLIQTEDLEVLCSAAEGNPPETRAAEEWISRDDHIAAIEEYMQRFLGSEPRAAGVGEEEIARVLFLHDYGPQFGDLFDRIAARGGLGDTSETQGMWDKTHSRARAILALRHNPAATSEGGK